MILWYNLRWKILNASSSVTVSTIIRMILCLPANYNDSRVDKHLEQFRVNSYAWAPVLLYILVEIPWFIDFNSPKQLNKKRKN